MKKLISIFICLSLFCAGAFADDTDNSRGKISGAMESILDDLGLYLPENSSLLGNQPDAYIGKLFPSKPCHLAAGFSVSATLMDTSDLSQAVQDFQDGITEKLNNKGAADSFSIDCPVPSKIPLPSAVFAVRLGGIVLPIDIGVYGVSTFNIIDDLSFKDFSADFNYSTFGFDVRYSVCEDKKLMPEVSFGAGYIYSNISTDFGLTAEYPVKSTYTGYTGDENARLNSSISLDSINHTLFASVQCSKKILIFEPYIGIKGFMTQTTSKYDWNYESYLGDNKDDNLSDKDSKDVTHDFGHNMSAQVFGGLGLQIKYFQLALNGAYNLTNNKVSASVGFNFKM